MQIDLRDPQLKELIEQEYIHVMKHPIEDLFIYNYTNKTQFDKKWNKYTLMCRGLVLDKEGNIIARPFDKFFNLGEGVLPNEAPKSLQEYQKEHGKHQIYEKYDGSLGILFWYKDRWHMATRGSFTSTQAARGFSMLKKKLEADKDSTHLFEIIYPENRIVVNYGDVEELVYLCSRNNDTGEYFVDDACWFDYKNIFKTNKMEKHIDNKEGYVLVFEDNFRLKVKFDEYKRLHKLLTGFNPKHIWEALSTNTPLDKILVNVPDEFYGWATKIANDLNNKYQRIDNLSKRTYKRIERFKDDRKVFALRALEAKHSSILFAMLDQKPYEPIIWKLIKPKGDFTFKVEI